MRFPKIIQTFLYVVAYYVSLVVYAVHKKINCSPRRLKHDKKRILLTVHLGDSN